MYYTPKIKSTTEEQVSWNLSQRISDQIDSLLCSGRRCNLKANILDCFFMYKEIRILINYHLKPEEIKLVDRYEDLINKTSIELKKISAYAEEEDEFEYIEGNQKAIKLKLINLKNKRELYVESYRKLILTLLDNYGYLMERKSDAAHMM